ncbi:gamma-butyrobetaine hydroxylase-like domain-containing protein [Paraburkholderia rhynchosiae]|uniref:Gamma-butyrobetaine hydroxylase-like N-terminal domain-containing protein n=1 Tax=Paraburkholderia rhynchosiae TaxID=487049 RepID=A0A2N7WYK4_9BURK|nr:DUF971 domain-containing protein [Paraburkholderia rhynchosiae]PMS34402.1 hypothetical protein C0Z16_02295 [Paraburkholderia rhynchosiae]CAB3640223.1 hypothetical protein LMG27174_00460 [Paraburkholderia rhynchosiae]
MSGLTPDTPVPTGVVVHSRSRVLELQYASGESYRLPFELLRVYSPSAEVQGHGPGQETLQTGKRDVTITMIEGVGNYAIQPTFSDGHSTGIYSWDLLYDMARRQDELWGAYLDRLAAAGIDRDAPMVSSSAAHGHCH